MLSSNRSGDHTDHQYNVANGAAIRKALTHRNLEVHRAANSSWRHPVWERGCQRFVCRTRPVGVITSQKSSMGVYHSASKELETMKGKKPSRKAARALRQILVALLLILTLSRFGDAETGRLAHTPAMRCVPRLDRSGLWVKRAASEGELLSFLDQGGTCYHQISEGVPKKNLTHTVQSARQGIHRTKERSRSACNFCSSDPTCAHCRCNSPTRSCNDERCMLEAKILPHMFGLTNLSPSCNQFLRMCVRQEVGAKHVEKHRKLET